MNHILGYEHEGEDDQEEGNASDSDVNIGNVEACTTSTNTSAEVALVVGFATSAAGSISTSILCSRNLV